MLHPTRILQKIAKWFPGPTGRVLHELWNAWSAWPITFYTAAPIVASTAGAITITAPVTFVSGTAAITGINVPDAITQAGDGINGYGARITLIPTGIFTWTAAGNIGLAGTAVVGKALDFTYDSATGKWYPSYIA